MGAFGRSMHARLVNCIASTLDNLMKTVTDVRIVFSTE